MHRYYASPLAAFFLFTASVASAATVDLGTLDSSVVPFSRSFFRTGNDTGSPLGPFTDTYTFALSETRTVFGDLSRTQGGRTRLTVILTLSGGSLAGMVTDSTLGAFNFGPLDAGNYSLNVEGVFSGLSGVSSYSGQISASDTPIVPAGVPDGPTWMLLTSGFFLLGTAARRRQGQQNRETADPHPAPQDPSGKSASRASP
jgi:hypothetical protein